MSNNQYVASDGSIVVGISPAAYEAYLAEKASDQTPSPPANMAEVISQQMADAESQGEILETVPVPVPGGIVQPVADYEDDYNPSSQQPTNMAEVIAQQMENAESQGQPLETVPVPVPGGIVQPVADYEDDYNPSSQQPTAGSYATPINNQPANMGDVISQQLVNSNQPQPIPAVNPFKSQENTIKALNSQPNVSDFAVGTNNTNPFFNTPQNEDYAQPFSAKHAPDGLILTKPLDNRVVGSQSKAGTGNLVADTLFGVGESFVKAGETMFFNPAGEFDFYMQPEKTGNLATDLFVAGFEGGLNALSLGMFSNVKYAQRLYEYEQADGSGLDRAMAQITVGTSVLGAGSAVGLGLNVAKTGAASIGKSGLLTVGKEIVSANKGQIFNVANEAAIVTTTTDPNLSSEEKLTTVGTSLVLGGAFGAGTRAAGSVLPKVLGGITKTKTVNTGGILTENTVSLWDKLNTPLIGGKSTIGKLVSPVTTPITAPLTAMGGAYAFDVGTRIAESDDKVRTATNIYTTELLPMVIGAKTGYGLVSKISDTARDYITTASFLKSSTGGKVKIGDVGKYIRENTLPETASDPMIALFDAKNLQHKNIVKSFELNKHYPNLPTNAPPKGYTNEPSRSKAMTDILSTSEPGTRLLYHATPYGKSFKGETTVGIGSSEQWGLYTAARPQSYYSKVDAYGKPTFSLFGNIPTKDPAIIGILGKDATAARATKGIGKWSDLTPEQRTKINVDIYKQFEGVEPKSRIVEPNIKAEKEWVIQPNAILTDVPIQPQWYMVKGQRVPFRMKEITGTKTTTPEPTTNLKTAFGKSKERPSRQSSSSSYREPSGDLSLSNLLGTRSFGGSDSKKDGGYKSSSDYLPSSTKGSGSSSRLGDDYSRSGDSSTKSDESYITDGSYSVRGGSSDIFGGSSGARGGSSSTRGGSSSTRGGSSSTRGGSSSTRGGSSSTRGSSGGSSIRPYNPYIPTLPEIPRKKKDEDDPQKSKNRRENRGIMDFFEVYHREIATADQFSGGLYGGDNLQTRDNFYLGYDAFMSKNENGIRSSAKKRTVKPAVKRYAKIRTNPTFDLGLGNLAAKSKPAKKGKGKGVNKKALQFF